MRRLFMIVLMINLILLCGCGSGAAEDETGLQLLRARLDNCAALSFQADLTADDGTYISEYTLRCSLAGDEMHIELLAPQLLAGVRARLREKSAALEFDGLLLDAGVLNDDGLSPIAAPATIVDALGQGAITQLRREKLAQQETVAFRVTCSENLFVDFWLDAQSFIPLRAELLSGERVAVACAISDWNLKEG